MNNDVRDKVVYYANEVDQLDFNDAVGKIDYLGFDGEVVETVWYTDDEKFKNQIKEDHYYGVPVTITFNKNDSVNKEFNNEIESAEHGIEFI